MQYCRIVGYCMLFSLLMILGYANIQHYVTICPNCNCVCADTYSLPVDATPAAAAAAAAASAAAAAAAARQGGGEVYRRPVFGSPPAVRRARRPDQPVRPPDQPTRPPDHHDHPATSCPCPLHTSVVIIL